jgi:hypothetical protein
VRYVGNISLQALTSFSLNEVNWQNNGLFEEFKLAMANLQACASTSSLPLGGGMRRAVSLHASSAARGASAAVRFFFVYSGWAGGLAGAADSISTPPMTMRYASSILTADS